MNKNFEEIDDAVEELTTSGKQDELDSEYMNKLKLVCRRCMENLMFTYRSLISQLEQPHAEIRYSAFQVIDQLFMRSHEFRELVLFDLQDIFVLTVESDKRIGLPPPIKVAHNLKKFFLAKFNLWYKTFAPGYRKLELGYEFLRDVMRVKFRKVEIQTLAEQDKELQSKKRHEDLRKSKLQQVEIQYFDRNNEITSNLKEMENCFELLVSKHTDTKNTSGDDQSAESNSLGLEIGNEAGISSHNFTLEVKISNKQMIYETVDNTHLINRLRELFRENRRYEEESKRWLNILVKCDSKDKKLLQSVLTLKNTLGSLCSKYCDLNINEASLSSDEEEGDIFVDVPEKTVENDDDEKPSCSKDLTEEEKKRKKISTSTLTQLNEDVSSQSKRDRHLQVAPVVKFDSDLKFWEKVNIEIGSVKYDSLHRFWKTNEHEENFVPPAVEASMRERCFKYEGEFQPVTRKCGALLSTGKFCERKDRKKCPFHGMIVDRDPFGRPIHPIDIERENIMKRKREEKKKLQIQKDIEASLGFSLSPKKKCRKGVPNRKDISRERYSRLTKLKDKNNSKQKLEKKIFSVRSLDRISNAMNVQIRRKHMERFGSNFNY